jgi:hypothetical protein
MAQDRKASFTGRLAEDYHAARRYIRALSAVRRRTTDRGRLASDLRAAYGDLGNRASEASVGTELPAFAVVSGCRKAVADAQAALVQRQQAVGSAKDMLAAELQKHSQIVDALSAQRKQCADAFSKAKADLDEADRAAKAVGRQIAGLQAELSHLGSAGTSEESPEQLQARLGAEQQARGSAAGRLATLEHLPAQTPPPAAPSAELQAAKAELARIDEGISKTQAAIKGHGIRRQLADQEPLKAAAQDKLASARAGSARASTALEAKAGELEQARKAAAQAKATAQADLAAAGAAETDAARQVESAQATLAESLRQFGQAVFEGGLAGGPVDAGIARVKALRESIAATDAQIRQAKEEAQAAKGGTMRLAVKAALAVLAVAAVTVGVVVLISWLRGKPDAPPAAASGGRGGPTTAPVRPVGAPAPASEPAVGVKTRSPAIPWQEDPAAHPGPGVRADRDLELAGLPHPLPLRRVEEREGLPAQDKLDRSSLAGGEFDLAEGLQLARRARHAALDVAHV